MPPDVLQGNLPCQPLNILGCLRWLCSNIRYLVQKELCPVPACCVCKPTIPCRAWLLVHCVCPSKGAGAPFSPLPGLDFRLPPPYMEITIRNKWLNVKESSITLWSTKIFKEYILCLSQMKLNKSSFFNPNLYVILALKLCSLPHLLCKGN